MLKDEIREAMSDRAGVSTMVDRGTLAAWANQASLLVEPRDVDIEELSSRLHDVYQLEAHRRGDVRHAGRYEDLSEDTKEWDRVLARWIVHNFVPAFTGPIPPPELSEGS